jgi:hypothetical protein
LPKLVTLTLYNFGEIDIKEKRNDKADREEEQKAIPHFLVEKKKL